MTTFLRRILAAIEQNSIMVFAFCCVVALPLAFSLADMHASNWREQHALETIESARKALRGRSHGIAAEVAFKFATMRSLSALLAADSELAAGLSDPSALPAAARRLKRIAESFGLSHALLLDRRGVCLATNEPANRARLVGVSLADRDYVAGALAGEGRTQLVVGRISSEPGFHFSAPVRQGGTVLGVLSLKVGLKNLADQFFLPTGVIVDDRGVVVLSPGLDHLLSVLPGGAALDLSEQECMLLYKRTKLEPLIMRPTRVYGQEAFFIDNELSPSLRHVQPVPGEALTVYGFLNLDTVLEETETLFAHRLVWFFAAIYLGLLFFTAGALHFIQDRGQRRVLRALNAELAELAQHDPLTGCYNRRPFNELLEREAQRSARTGQPFALAIFDLDNFKSVNDTHGHMAGDAVLVQVAGAIRSELRQIDTVARMGGDEFAALLPGADAHTAAEVLRRVVERLQSTPLDTPAGPLTQTLSVGAAASHGELTPRQLAEDADEALYESKQRGRNQVVVHGRI